MTVTRSLVEDLERLLGDRVTNDESVRAEHGGDESSHPPQSPDLVVFPRSTEEVAAVVRACARHRVPLVPYGRGSAVEGGVVATHGGVCVDLGGMNKVLTVHERDLDAHVEAGVTQMQLNAELDGTDLFFPVDPGAEASLGGMASTRASGTNAVRYGTMRENVLSLTVVLADGTVVRTARRARKSSAGYDLTRLFVGAEGTLGIVTEVVVRLHRRPEALSVASCTYHSIEDAVRTVIEVIQGGIPVARAELLDEISIEAVNRYAGLDYEVAPTVFFEFHGTSASVGEQAERVGAIAGRCGGGEFRWAADESERERLWKARHEAYYAMLALRPGSRSLTTDVCVPVSRLAECIGETKRELDASDLPSPLLGHVGDGNFHILILVDPDRPEELEEAEALNRRIVERALGMEGTCTGEHGVGIGKREFLRSEHGAGLDLMRRIKDALDPDALMNPGKVLEETD